MPLISSGLLLYRLGCRGQDLSTFGTHWLHNVKGCKVAKFNNIYIVEVRENWTSDANFSNETNYTDSGMAFSAGCAGCACRELASRQFLLVQLSATEPQFLHILSDCFCTRF